MTDDTTPLSDPLGVVLSVLESKDRQRFGELLDALTEAVEAHAAAGVPTRSAAAAARAVAQDLRTAGDPLWPAFSAAAARLEELGDSD